jgi:hypothetical protein
MFARLCSLVNGVGDELASAPCSNQPGSAAMRPDDPNNKPQPEPTPDRQPGPVGNNQSQFGVTLSWSVAGTLSPPSPTPCEPWLGRPGEETVTLTWSVAPPPGLTLDPATGLVSGLVWQIGDAESARPAADDEEPPQPFIVEEPPSGPDKRG